MSLRAMPAATRASRVTHALSRSLSLFFAIGLPR
ncbi:hypothetical protein BPC006_I2519 [Burkholderia pseudomallei BPC006]|nr:hypothetical protein BPC006_I2519 [Burkholderia pseudomallei BPC006]